MESGTDTAHGTQILPHLYRVAWWDCAGADIVNCDVYAIDCGESVTLIDSGRGGASFGVLKGNLEHRDLWGRVRTCLITHLHRDHAGGVRELQAEGVCVWGGQAAAAFGSVPEARVYFDNCVPKMDRALRDKECVAIGELAFEALGTPGHTSTDVTYLVEVDGVRCAFTGDMVMPAGGTGYTGSFDFDAESLISSLRRLSQREFDAVLTGHMLRSTQPEGFWIKNGKDHVVETLEAMVAEKRAPVRKSAGGDA